jgi:hypothetical protein
LSFPGTDLWIIACTDQVFVYSFELDIEQFKDALSRSLSVWLFVADPFLQLDDDHYCIEMSDNLIPVTYAENTELPVCPIE